jgi:hypothetical protein
MTLPTPSQETVFGYLSAIELPDHGFFGGYLLVSLLGRPLEFHCTAPVRPSRAQQILYGPTLLPYLLGEQIGGTLLAKSTLTPKIVLTDQLAALCLRSQILVPLVWLVAADSDTKVPPGEHLTPDSSDGISGVTDASFPVVSSASIATFSGALDRTPSRRFTLLGHDWELPVGFESDHDRVTTLLAALAQHVDLPEPFGRIHEAVREAQRIGERGPDAHGQAA